MGKRLGTIILVGALCFLIACGNEEVISDTSVSESIEVEKDYTSELVSISEVNEEYSDEDDGYQDYYDEIYEETEDTDDAIVDNYENMLSDDEFSEILSDIGIYDELSDDAKKLETDMLDLISGKFSFANEVINSIFNYQFSYMDINKDGEKDIVMACYDSIESWYFGAPDFLYVFEKGKSFEESFSKGKVLAYNPESGELQYVSRSGEADELKEGFIYVYQMNERWKHHNAADVIASIRKNSISVNNIDLEDAFISSMDFDKDDMFYCTLEEGIYLYEDDNGLIFMVECTENGYCYIYCRRKEDASFNLMAKEYYDEAPLKIGKVGKYYVIDNSGNEKLGSIALYFIDENGKMVFDTINLPGKMRLRGSYTPDKDGITFYIDRLMEATEIVLPRGILNLENRDTEYELLPLDEILSLNGVDMNYPVNASYKLVINEDGSIDFNNLVLVELDDTVASFISENGFEAKEYYWKTAN